MVIIKTQACELCFIEEEIVMNKIYKVVYNQAKNAYEVVSELGKNRSKMKGSSLVKGVVATAIVSSPMFTGGGQQVQLLGTIKL